MFMPTRSTCTGMAEFWDNSTDSERFFLGWNVVLKRASTFGAVFENVPIYGDLHKQGCILR